MNIPKKINKENRTYIFVQRINNRMCLYKEEKTGFKECFLIDDLIQRKNGRKEMEARLWC